MNDLSKCSCKMTVTVRDRNAHGFRFMPSKAHNIAIVVCSPVPIIKLHGILEYYGLWHRICNTMPKAHKVSQVYRSRIPNTSFCPDDGAGDDVLT